MAILASGKFADGVPVQNVAPHGFAYKSSGNFPLSLTKCNKIAAHFRECIARFGTSPTAAAWVADLERLEKHIEEIKARDKARRSRT